MSFEKLFQLGEEKKEGPEMEVELAEKSMQKVMESVKEKIDEKKTNPEIKDFFDKKDSENKAKLSVHPDSKVRRVFEHSSALMHEVLKKSNIITEKRPRYFHPKKI
jgi:hypothetical protein